MTRPEPVILQADRKLGETRELRTELRRRGADVRMADTAEEAMRQALLAPPDLLILDDDLNEGRDPDLVEYFASTAPQAETILLSSQPGQLTRDVGRGFLFHGLRPVSSGMLLDLIMRAMPDRLSDVPAPSAPGPMVLLVDDDRPTLDALSRLLGRHGYRVSTFDDPARVMTAIPEVAPDVAVVDVAMPGIDGRELSRRIRDRYRGLFPIVLHTARTSDADRAAGFRHGADYYLPKPCEPHRLLDVVGYYADHLDSEERHFIEERL